MLDAALPLLAATATAVLPAFSLRVVAIESAFGQPIGGTFEPGFVHVETVPVTLLDTPTEIHIVQRHTREWVAIGQPFRLSFAEPPATLAVGEIFTGDLVRGLVALPDA